MGAVALFLQTLDFSEVCVVWTSEKSCICRKQCTKFHQDFGEVRHLRLFYPFKPYQSTLRESSMTQANMANSPNAPANRA